MASIAKELPSYIATELADRASASHASSWKTAKKVWVEFYGTDGTKITNGSGIDTQYNTPNPGVTGVDVKFKGSLGSLREVTVNYKCWSKAQLSAMSKAYMQLGRTAAVRFGWSIMSDGSRVSGFGKVQGNDLPDAQLAAAVAAKTNKGCVASYKGIVDNFTFSLDADGGYTCMCHFITPAEAALDIDIDLDTGGEACESPAEDGDAKTNKNSNLIQAIRNLQTAVLTAPKGGTSNPDTGEGWSGYIVIERERTEEEKANESWGSWIGGIFTGALRDTDTVYCSWAWIEDVLLPNALFPQEKGGKKAIYSMDSSGADMTLDAATWCGDPLVGHIHNHGVYNDAQTYNITTFAGDLLTQAANVTPQNPRHLWFDTNYLMSIAKQSEKLQDFLQRLLDGFNAVSGNRWDWTVIVDPEDPSKLLVVDAGNVTSTVEPTTIQMYGVNSVCTNVTLDTQVPNGIKASLLYGANGAPGKGGNKESGEFRFQPGTDKLTPALKDLEQPVVECSDQGAKKSSKDPVEVFEEAMDDLFGGVEQTTVDKAISSHMALPEVKAALEDDSEGADVLIPLNLGFDLEGIEGIPYGAMVQGNHIPGVYKSESSFMVTGISHNVSEAGWTTSIETIMRRK